jgi:hypothetical protein
MSSTVSVGPAAGGFIRYRLPFDAALIAAIKRRIPKHARAYRPDVKAWDILPGHTETMRELLLIHLGVIIAPQEDELEELRQLRCEVAALRAKLRDAVFVPEPCQVLHILPSAPPEVVRAAHRALARRYHPDAGGDTLTMQRINHAADQLQQKEAC